MTRAQVEFPQIHSAYAAVERWIRSRRLEIAGSPREVSLTDFLAAGPTDEVCDVALPIECNQYDP